jgi:hypothetical protein
MRNCPTVSARSQPQATWALARRLWPKAEEIRGTGEWASVSYCSGGGSYRFATYLTVYLYETQSEALQAKDKIDRSLCGGSCGGPRGHFVVHLSERDRIAGLNSSLIIEEPRTRRFRKRSPRRMRVPA